MIKSSIHLQPENISVLLHYTRVADISYLIDDSSNNEYDRDMEDAFKYYLSLKKDEKKYLWEAVINLKPTHVLGDVQRLTKEIEKRYGLRSVQISIHNDEGYRVLHC